MSDNLQLKISATLNTGLALKDLNLAIKALSKHPSLQKLQVKIDVDKSFTQSINGFITATQKLSKNIDDQNRIVRETQNVWKQADGTIKTVTEQLLKNNNVITKTKIVHDANKKAILSEDSATAKLTARIGELNKAQLDSITISRNKSGNLTAAKVTTSSGNIKTTENLLTGATTETQNIKKDREETQKLVASKEALRKKIVELAQVGQLSTARLRELASATNNSKSAADIQNVISKYNELKSVSEQLIRIQSQQYQANKRQTQDEIRATEQLTAMQRKAEVQVANLIRRYGTNINSGGLNSLLSQMNSLTTRTANYRTQALSLQHEINQLGASAQTAASHTITFGNALKTAFQRFPIWVLTATAIYAPIRALQSGIRSIYEMDTAMTDLQKVTDATGEQYSEFLKTTNDVATSLGALSVDVVKATTEWARLGYSIQQAATLAKETTIYANVGDMSADQAGLDLISAIKGFGIEVDKEGTKVRKVVDIYNEVGNKFAISSAGIGDALRRSASSLSAAGNSIEQSVALVTAANSTLQDPTSVGTALKTVSMRMRGISEDGEDLGTLIPSLEKKFNSLGLSLKKDDNTFKSTYDIIDELAGKWSDLTDFEQADITELIAGKRQGNVVTSLLDNWTDAQRALKVALDSTGSAAKENETYLNSLKAKVSQFKNTVTGFWESSISTDFLSNLLEMGTKIVSTFGNVTNAIGILPTVVGLATTAILLFTKRGLTPLYTLLTTIPVKLSLLKLEFRSIAASEGVATAATRIFATSLMTLGKTIAPIAIITGITWALGELFGAMSKSNDAIRDSNQLYEENKSQLKDVLSYYQDNYAAIHNDKDVKDQLYELQNKLISTFGDEAQGLDLVNGKYDEQIAKINELNKKNLNDKINSEQLQVNAFNEKKYDEPTIGGFGSSTYTIDGDFNEGNLKVQEYYKKLSDLKEKIFARDKSIFEMQALIPKTEQDWENAQEKVNRKIEELNPIMEVFNQLEQDKKQGIILSTVEQANFNDEQQLMFNQLSDAFNNQPSDNYQKSLSNLSSTIKSMDGKPLNEIVEALKQIPDIKSNPDLVNNLNNLIESQKKVQQEGFDDSKILERLSDAYSDAEKAVKPLNQAIYDLTKEQKLSSDQVSELVLLYPELAKHIHKTADGWDIESSALDLVRQAQIDLQIAQLDAQTNMTSDLYDNLKTRLDYYDIELGALLEIEDAQKRRAKVAEGFKNSEDVISNIPENLKDQPGLKEWIDKVRADEKAAADYLDKVDAIDLLKQQLKDPLSGVSTGTKDNDLPDKDKDLPEQINQLDAWISKTNESTVSIQKTNDALDERAKKLKDEGKYAEALQAENDLIKSQGKQMQALMDANVTLENKRKTMQSNSKINMSDWVDASGNESQAFLTLLGNQKSKTAQDALQAQFDDWKSLTVAIRANNAAMTDNKKALEESYAERDDTKLQNTNAYLEKRNKIVEGYNETIANSQKQQQLLTEGTAAYNAETKKQVDTRVKIVSWYKEEINWIKNRITQGGLEASQIKSLTDQMVIYQSALTDVYIDQKTAADQAFATWKENAEKIADDGIDKLKDALEDAKDAATDLIQAEMDAEDKRHQDRMDNIDKEQQQYNDYVDAILRGIDRQESSDDYDKTLKTKQGEQSEIQTKINELLLDDSVEAKAKREDLQQQLADKIEEIEELTHDRNIDLQKENLDDLKRSNDEQVKIEQNKEDAINESNKAALDKRQKDNETYWNAILEDDAKFDAIRVEFMNGTASGVNSIFSTLKDNVTGHMTEIGSSFDVAALQFQDFLTALGNLQTAKINFNNDLMGNPDTGGGGIIQDVGKIDTTGTNTNPLGLPMDVFKTYLNNKKIYEENKGTKAALKAQVDNATIRIQNGINNDQYSYDELKKYASYDTGGRTPAWGPQGKFALLHEKEMVLNKFDTKNLLKTVNFSDKIMENMRKLNLNPLNFLSNKNNEKSSVINNNMDVTVQVYGGDENTGKIIINSIEREFKSKGIFAT